MSIIIHTYFNSIVGIVTGALIAVAILFVIGMFWWDDENETAEELITKLNLRAISCSLIFAGWIVFVGRGIL